MTKEQEKPKIAEKEEKPLEEQDVIIIEDAMKEESPEELELRRLIKAEGERKDLVANWVPKTKLGKLVKEKKLTNILQKNWKSKNRKNLMISLCDKLDLRTKKWNMKCARWKSL